MKSNIAIALAMAALGFNALAAQEKAPAASNQDVVMPSIILDEIPLRDAVKNLVRQMSQRNYIFDPRVIASFAGPGGEFANEPNVSGRWEKVTAEQALTAILADHKLKLVKNPATTVARIVPADDNSKPATFPFLTDKDPVIPVIVMMDASFGDAVMNLARQALILPVTLDPQLDAAGSAPGGKALSQTTVSFRWEKISARQALAALLESHGLVWVPGEAGSPSKITRAPPAK